MTVYVDDAFIPYGRMKMSHMIADTEEELHEMADKIGVKRKWFQERSMPHYDVCKSKRQAAIKFGAEEISQRQLVIKVRVRLCFERRLLLERLRCSLND